MKVNIPKKIREDDMEIVFKNGQELSVDVTHSVVDERLLFAVTDYGMDICFDRFDNFLVEEGDTDEDIIIKVLTFDLFHAFCHPCEDPNYSHYHWALYGNLKDRVDVYDQKDYNWCED